MGINSINSFMKTMATQAELQGKKLTNHSARKTFVKKLKAANQPRSAIIGVTGHTNERSLADYEEGDENEQKPFLPLSVHTLQRHNPAKFISHSNGLMP